MKAPTLRTAIIAAVRSQRAAPSFALVALLSLGAATAVTILAFAAFGHITTRDDAYRSPEELMLLMEHSESACQGCLDQAGPGTARSWLETRSAALASLALYSSSSSELGTGNLSEPTIGAVVSADFFGLLGTSPMLGRVIGPADGESGASRVVVISHELWSQRFGRSREAVGSVLTVNGNPHVVIGVMPRGFQFPSAARSWTAGPVGLPAVNAATRYGGVARVVSGTTAAELSAVFPPLRSVGVDGSPTEETVRTVALAFTERGGALPASAAGMVLGAALLALLVAGINVQNLFLVRTMERRSHYAVHAAIGATPRDLMFQAFVEVQLMVLAGGAVGLLIASWVRPVVEAHIASQWGVALDLSFRLGHLPVLLLALTVAGAVIAMGPALIVRGAGLAGSPMTTMRAFSDGRNTRRSRELAVVLQVALSLSLIAGASLFVRAYSFVQEIDLGYDSRELVVGRLPLDTVEVADGWNIRRTAEELDGALARQAVTHSHAVWLADSPSLLAGPGKEWLSVEGRTEPLRELERPLMMYHVTPAFFTTVGMPVLVGRGFGIGDDLSAPPVVIVNEQAARFWWPHETAIGRRIRLGGRDGPSEWMTVVGVVANSRAIDDRGLLLAGARPDLFLPQLFMPIRQLDYGMAEWTPTVATSLLLGARASGVQQASVIAGIAYALEQSASGIPIERPMPLRERQLQNETFRQLLATRNVIGILALVAAGLSLLGVFGMLADYVERRRREIGIRRALGARDTHILRDVLGATLRLGLLGVLAGGLLVVAAQLVGSMNGIDVSVLQRRGLLFGQLSTVDALVLAVVVVVVLVLLAVPVPLRRALGIAPMTVMRE